jgi:hypothetical protein
MLTLELNLLLWQIKVIRLKAEVSGIGSAATLSTHAAEALLETGRGLGIGKELFKAGYHLTATEEFGS